MKQVSIFISYSHKDEDFKDDIIAYLKSANMPDSFEAWSDRDINIGDVWKKKIFNAIDKSKAFVCLISKNFLSSDFIMKTEIPRILKRFEQPKKLFFFPY